MTAIPEMRLNDAIGGLIKRAFLNRTHDREADTFRYSLLPLTADFVRQKSEHYSELKSLLKDRHNAYLLERGATERRWDKSHISFPGLRTFQKLRGYPIC